MFKNFSAVSYEQSSLKYILRALVYLAGTKTKLTSAFKSTASFRGINPKIIR